MIAPGRFLMNHKILTLLILSGLVMGGVVYARHRTSPEPLRYVATAATKGSLVVSLRASGQVSGQSQLDVKPLVSGALTSVAVKSGDAVKAGQALFTIDQKVAARAVRDAVQSLNNARISLQSAQLSLKKLQEPPDALAVLQAENTVHQAERALDKLRRGPDAFEVQQAEADLQTQRDHAKLAADGVTPQVVRDAYDAAVLSLKTTVQSFQQLLFDTETVLGNRDAVTTDPYIDLVRDTPSLVQATNAYLPVKQAVERLRTDVDALALTGASTREIDQVMTGAQTTATQLEPYLRLVYNVTLAMVPSQSRSQSTIDTMRSTIQADRTTLTSKQTTLTTLRQSFASARDTYQSAQANVSKAQLALQKLQEPASADDIAAAQEKIDEAKKAFAKLQQGPSQIDLQSAKNAIAQRQADVTAAAQRVADAQEALADYTVRATFDGTAARVTVQKGDQVSPSTVLTTLLTDAKIAQLSLNEVDVAKLRVGQKATLSFDAVPDLTIAGSVYDIDTIGTVSQGVVNYAAKILFQTQDPRVKSGMSVSASIITDVRTDIILVSNAAIRRTNGEVSVQILPPSVASSTDLAMGVVVATPPENRIVEVGISNDQATEITQGLQEGELIVTRIIDPAQATKAPAATTNGTGGLRLQGLGGASGGFGGVRFGGGGGR